MTPALFETYCRIAKEQRVRAFRVDQAGLAVELVPDLSDAGTGTTADPPLAPGDWKRGPDLAHDPMLSDWD